LGLDLNSEGSLAFLYDSLLSSITARVCSINQIMNIQAFHTSISKAGVNAIIALLYHPELSVEREPGPGLNLIPSAIAANRNTGNYQI